MRQRCTKSDQAGKTVGTGDDSISRVGTGAWKGV